MCWEVRKGVGEGEGIQALKGGGWPPSPIILHLLVPCSSPHLLQGLEQSLLCREQGAELGRVLGAE